MKFIADAMLGKLAKWLRIIGYDTVYDNSIEDKQLIKKAENEQRIILTKDTQLIKQKINVPYLFIEDNSPIEQLRQVVNTFKLNTNSNLFRRCLECNKNLISVPREKVRDLVPSYVYQTQKEFYQCPTCRKVFWKGTHEMKMLEKIKELR